MIMPLAFAFLTITLAHMPDEKNHIVREEIEWLDVWVPGNSNTTLPKVLLIGDSMARGYSRKSKTS